ncbi:PQQ-dependent sugar dehydrogenase [Alteromonas sediminis]|uniref:PQQ-dependent sugar dehydrogenase n=1 Tax=Alteromonas sediminis TaxID=2259342 RepID=UPI0030B80C14
MLKIALASQSKPSFIGNFIKAVAGRQCRSVVFLWMLTLNIGIVLPATASLPVEPYVKTTLAEGLNSPWSAVVTPQGEWLVTERDGHVVIATSPSDQRRVKLTLNNLYVAGQGGLLDIVLSPSFTQTQEVFISFAQGDSSANRLVVAKMKYDGNTFTQPKEVFAVSPDKSTPVHYAGRLLFLPDASLLVASGDGFDYREKAQVRENQLGKILRINQDGSVPTDNPFTEREGQGAHAVYTYGHRNPQGLILDTDANRIYSHEHGPAGGDELNQLHPGVNYGWPVVTLGKDYSGARISPFTAYGGMQNPLVNWTPSIAPSGMAYYANVHSQFPSLQGHALVTTLVDKALYAIHLANGQFSQRKAFSDISGRLRDVIVSPRGEVAVLKDGAQASLILLTSEN